MKRAKIIGVILACVILAGFLAFRHSSRQSAIESTLAWSGLSELPQGLEVESIQVKGSAFSREFVLTLSGSLGVIEPWLETSPNGVEVLELIRQEQRVFQVELEPQQGATYSEITLDKQKQEKSLVIIRAYWS